MSRGNNLSVPKAMQSVYDAVTEITDRICAESLDDEYAALARDMTAALSRKRPSSLSSGKPQTWACGVVYALGRINFLFDKSQSPHMRADELATLFGVAPSTASAKAKAVMDALKTGPLDVRWCLPSRLDDNPMAWLISVNGGFIVDARHMPREVQEEAFRLGLIPYMPGERDTLE